MKPQYQRWLEAQARRAKRCLTQAQAQDAMNRIVTERLVAAQEREFQLRFRHYLNEAGLGQ